jgi:hypothetical protein
LSGAFVEGADKIMHDVVGLHCSTMLRNPLRMNSVPCSRRASQGRDRVARLHSTLGGQASPRQIGSTLSGCCARRWRICAASRRCGAWCGAQRCRIRVRAWSFKLHEASRLSSRAGVVPRYSNARNHLSSAAPHLLIRVPLRSLVRRFEPRSFVPRHSCIFKHI